MKRAFIGSFVKEIDRGVGNLLLLTDVPGIATDARRKTAIGFDTLYIADAGERAGALVRLGLEQQPRNPLPTSRPSRS